MNKKLNLIKFLFIIYWFIFLCNTDSYFEPYLLTGILGIYALFKNKEYSKSKLDIFFSIFLSLCISLANYKYFNIASLNNILDTIVYIFNFSLISIISYLIFKEILNLISHIDLNKGNSNKKHHIFLISFLLIFIVDTFVLFTTRYPGTLSPDSINQISQIIDNSYSNHHPFYHTMIIKLCLSVGQTLFGNINAGVATYSIFSIFISALSFSYVISTISKSTNNIKLTIIVGIWYLIMPFYIEFSYTMWKDVFFGLSLMVYVTSLYRVFKNIGNSLTNYIVLIISSFGICLLRSNGYFVYILSTIIFIIIFKDKKKLIAIFILVILGSYILKYPLLNSLNVSSTDKIESLSIPLQQVSRVIVDKDIDNTDKNLISKIIDCDLVKEVYEASSADEIKNLIREKGNASYLENNLNDYLKFYISLGLKYPLSYISAWIDQTRGYYNSGYEFFRWGLGVEENTYGISQVVNSNILYKLFNIYSFRLFNLPIIRTLVCIGLYFWLVIISLYKSIINKNKLSYFISIPFIIVVLSLCIASPVFSEFRYVYSLFCAVPILLIFSFLKN